MSSLRQSLRSSMPANAEESSMPPLENGDRLDQKTFHERYEAMPEDTRAELIGGIVFMSSPLKRPHGRMRVRAAHWLAEYEYATPGVETFDNATNILGEESEPQPDLCLLIAPDNGGQTRAEDDYIVGAPELVVEVASRGFRQACAMGQFLPDMPACSAPSLRVRRFRLPRRLPIAEF